MALKKNEIALLNEIRQCRDQFLAADPMDVPFWWLFFFFYYVSIVYFYYTHFMASSFDFTNFSISLFSSCFVGFRW